MLFMFGEIRPAIWGRQQAGKEGTYAMCMYVCHNQVSPQAAFIEDQIPSSVALVFMFRRGVKLGHLSGGGGQARKDRGFLHSVSVSKRCTVSITQKFSRIDAKLRANSI